MKAQRRLEIIRCVNRGEEWTGLVCGRQTSIAKADGKVNVWLHGVDSGASFGAPTVTDALKAVTA